MRRFFAISTIVGAVAMTLGACGSDSGGGNNNPGDGGGATGGGGTGGGGNQCAAYCAKLTAAGCAPANCPSDCASKATCVGAWNSLVSCVAGTGTVTCNAGQPSLAGCDSQSQAYANCLSPSGGGTGGGTGGSTSGSCAGICGSPDPAPGSSPECYCDDLCEGNDDCCPDKATECPNVPDGICKKYCCSASDCASGESCAALDAATIGTLGVCVTGGATDAGTGGAAGGPATDSGPPVDSGNTETGAGGAPPVEGGSGLPAGCIIAPNPPCNPITNAPCAAGEACDLGQNGVQCFAPPNDVQPGGDCSNSSGPFCIGGYHCATP